MIVLITGVAGAGKSTIAKATANWIRDNSNLSVDSYDFSDPVKESIQYLTEVDLKTVSRENFANYAEAAKIIDRDVWNRQTGNEIITSNHEVAIVAGWRFSSQFDYFEENFDCPIITVNVEALVNNKGRKTLLKNTLTSRLERATINGPYDYIVVNDKTRHQPELGAVSLATYLLSLKGCL